MEKDRAVEMRDHCYTLLFGHQVVVPLRTILDHLWL